MKIITTVLVSLFIVTAGFAQKGLEGLWEGTITKGGIYSEAGDRVELFLEVEGSKISGRSYVHMPDGKVVEMELKGSFYQDRSIYLEDIEFVPPADSSYVPPFSRKYQLIYTRSIWNNKLEGYWQQIIPTPFHSSRKRGRIFLKKVSSKKA